MAHRKSLRWAILMALVALLVSGGCSQIPIPHKQENALLVVNTTPANAIVYMRARTGKANGPAGTEYWAVGTTPFEGELEPGFWDVKIETAGYQPVEVLVRAVPGRAQSYDLHLVSMSGHRWK